MNSPDFKTIAANIKARKEQFTWLIDEHILHHADDHFNIANKFDQTLLPFRHLLHQIDKVHINRFRAEYIAHKIFRKNGHIHSILKQSAIKKLPATMVEHLTAMSTRPWKYAFAEIREDYGHNFFMIEDVFTREKHLLYSPGMTATKKDHAPKLWFCLIGDNGECWETYGLIQFFTSFDADDIFFYMTELNPTITSDEELLSAIDNNPTAIFMLIAFSTSPPTYHKTEELRYCYAEDYLDQSTIEKSIKYLPESIERKDIQNIIQLSEKPNSGFPHFAKIYFDIKNEKVFRIACTESGFESLNDLIHKINLNLEDEPLGNVSFTMFVTAGKITKKKIHIDPYEQLFESPQESTDDQSLVEANLFIKEIMPYINAGKTPDIKQIADKVGIDIETANSIYTAISKYKPE